MSEEIQVNWNITTLECFSNFSGYSDVVYNVHWDCLGYYSGISGVYNSRTYSVTNLNVHDISGDFTPYSALTSNQVLNWTWSQMGEDSKNQFEKDTTEKIIDQISPSVVSPALPWGVSKGSVS